MSDDVLPSPSPARRTGRSFVRRVVYPVLVILAIVAAIYYIDHRNNDNVDSTGQAYGIRDMSPALNSDGIDVAANVGSMAPDFELEKVAASGDPAISGESWLTDFRGHPVVLNFWATWCEPCRQETAEFVRASGQYKGAGLVVIGVDQQESPASFIQPFAQKYGVEYPLLVDRDGEVGQKYRMLGLPMTVFIDANGIIQKIFRGELQRNDDPSKVQGAIDQSELDAAISQIIVVPTPTPGANSGSG